MYAAALANNEIVPGLKERVRHGHFEETSINFASVRNI